MVGTLIICVAGGAFLLGLACMVSVLIDERKNKR